MTRILMAALIALACPATALASPAPAGFETEVVRHRDLDLSQSRDAEIMMRRIDRAALQACGASAGSLRELRLAVRASDCFRDTVARTVSAVDAPAVSAAYADQFQQVAAR